MVVALVGMVGLLAASPAAEAAGSSRPCDPVALGEAAETARFNVIASVDGAEALAAWGRVLENGGAIAWPVTEYNVDARSTFLFTFDRDALRVYRAAAFGDNPDRELDGCVDPDVQPEAIIPWRDVREIEAGNWVLWFRFRQPVTIASDRGKRKTVKELKAYFHGGRGGDLTYYYNLKHEGRLPFWNIDVYRVENFRGIAVGPTDYQRRLLFVIASTVDPEGHIALKRKGRGAGW